MVLHIKAILDRLGLDFGGYWGQLCASWDLSWLQHGHLGPIWTLSWAILAPTWLSWLELGSLLGHLGQSCVRLATHLARTGARLTPTWLHLGELERS